MPEEAPNQNQEKPKKMLLDRVDMIVGGVFAVLIVATGVAMFTVDSSYLYGDVANSEEVIRTSGALDIAYDQPLTTYEPTAMGVLERDYLTNTYEGLVRFDRDFNLEPALALSWGMLDDDLWQFKLRPNVKFHDGSNFGGEDVISSIERAQIHKDSNIADLVEHVEKVTEVEANVIQIKTDEPDATLLSKLTLLPMVPSELEADVTEPVGTGPYVFLREADDEWQFARFDNYWGEAPSFPELNISYISDKLARYEALISGKVNVLGQVPPVFVSALLEQDYKVASLPSLEVHFFMFDSESEDSIFRHEEARNAVAYALDVPGLTDLASEFAVPASQFMSRGVFGYNPDLEPYFYDITSAKKLLRNTGKTNWETTLDLPEGLEGLGEYVVEKLEDAGITVTVDIWDAESYEELIRSGASDFYFLAWRSDTGDATDFFTNVVHSRGDLNGGVFEDNGMDDLIEAATQDVMEATRLDKLQELSELVREKVIGVPLFETDSLVGVSPGLNWEPRMDNLIFAHDIS